LNEKSASRLAETLDASTNKQTDSVAPESVKLIKMQLDTLEQRRIMWQGELSPGQPMQWEISDETPRREHQQPQTSPEWKSTVRFALPSLGSVAATIHLSGGHVRIQVGTDSEETAAALKNHSNMLAQALDAAGSPLDYLQIKKNG
jgi:hypothetical protein